jgi:hypothetical protein
MQLQLQLLRTEQVHGIHSVLRTELWDKLVPVIAKTAAAAAAEAQVNSSNDSSLLKHATCFTINASRSC